MIPEERIRSLVEDEIGLLGLELVKLDVISRGRRRVLRLFIDRADGSVSIDDCVRVSRAVGLVLESEESLQTPYNLEVSSPGINRPLVKPEHFERFSGRSVRIEFAADGGERKTVIGEIARVENGAAVIVSGEGETAVPFDRMMRANLHGEDWNVGGGKKPVKARGGKRH